jgi:hypothetical protein
MSYPILLRAVVIDADNKAIRFKEGASTSTLSLAENTYYLRGDGTADDLLKAIKDAFDAAGATNTYTVAIAWSADPAGVSAVITITQTGGATFQILWADGATTFNPAWLGFADANTADSTAAKTSTLSPSLAWVSDGPYAENEPVDRPQGTVQRARSRRAKRTKTGNTGKDRVLGMSFVAAARTHQQFASGGDTARCFNTFLDELREGPPFELHLVGTTTGFTLASTTSSTKQATLVLGEEGDAEFKPRRQSNGVQLYSFAVECWEYVA